MRHATALLTVVLALGSWACAAEPTPGTEAEPAAHRKEVQQRRDDNRRTYNKVYQQSLLRQPQQAAAEFDKAQKKMEKLNPADPGDPAIGEALFQRGYLLAEAGKYKEAIKLFEELVRRFPRHAWADDALYQIGYVCHHRLKDYDRAAEAYTRLVKTYRNRETAVQALWQGAQVAEQQFRVEDVKKNLNDAQVVAGKQRYQRGQQEVPNWYEAQSAGRLDFISRNSAAGEGSKALALYLKADNDLQLGNTRDAYGNFQAIQKKHAGSKLADDAAFGLAECRRLDYQLDAAARLYADFLKKHPESELVPKAKFRLAELKRVAGREEEAIKLYAEVLAELGDKSAKGEAQLRAELGRFRELSESRLKEMNRARAGRAVSR